MKRFIVTFVLAFVALASFAQTENATGVGIQFETGTWAEILAKAKKQNKYVFLDAYTTWCGACKWMDKNVFPTTEACEYFNKNFVKRSTWKKAKVLTLRRLTAFKHIQPICMLMAMVILFTV